MVRTKEEVIQKIYKDFECLAAQKSYDSGTLQAKKMKLLRELSKIDTTTYSSIEKSCKCFIPKDSDTLLKEMRNQELCTEGIDTEDQVSTLLTHLLTPYIQLSEEDLNYCQSLPSPTMQALTDYIGPLNVGIIQDQTNYLLRAREEAIDELLAQIPPTGSLYSYFYH